MYLNGLRFISRLIKSALCAVLVGVCISATLSAMESGPKGKEADTENSEELGSPSSSSSSSSSGSQEDWQIEGNKLTVSVHAIRELDPTYLKRIKSKYPNIREIQVIRRTSKKMAGSDIQSLGRHFPEVTILRLNSSGLRQDATNFFGRANVFPYLSELYLDDNGEIKDVEVLSKAPFASNLTRLSLGGTKVKSLSEERLKQLFSQIKEVTFNTPERANAGATKKRKSATNTSSSNSRRQASSNKRSRLLTAVPQQQIEDAGAPAQNSEDTSVNLPSEEQPEQSVVQADTMLSNESIDQPSSTSSSSSSSASNSQEGWQVEGDKLTISIEAIRSLGPKLLKISQEHPNIQEIQVVRGSRHRNLPIAVTDVLSLGDLFPRITILRLNNLSLRQCVVEALAWANIFPDLSELYLDNNGQLQDIEVLSQAFFASNLTRLSLKYTKVKSLSEERLKQLFPQAKEVIFSTSTSSLSSSSSSSASNPQEDWKVEGDKLTVFVEAIKALGSDLLKRIKSKYPNIREIQVIRRIGSKKRIARRDIKLLGQHFPEVTILRLNNLWLPQDATSFFGRANVFPRLSELYLDGNGEIKDIEVLSEAPFASTLTRLSLTGTRVNPLSEGQLRQRFPRAAVIFDEPERATASTRERARETGTSSSLPEGEVSSSRSSRLLTAAPLSTEGSNISYTELFPSEIQRAGSPEAYLESNNHVEDVGTLVLDPEDTSVNNSSEQQFEQSAVQTDTMLPEVEVNPIYQAIDRHDVDLVREILRAQPKSLYPQVGSEGLTPLQVVLLFIKTEDPVRLQLLLAILEGALQSYDNTIFEEAVSRIDDAELKALLRELLNAGSTFSNTAPEIMERLQQLDEFRERREAIGDIYEEPSFSEVQQAEFPEVYAHAEDAESFAMSPGAVSVDSSVYEFSAESISSEDEEELIDESIDQPSSTSSSSSSSSFQEGWRVEDDKLTVSIEAIRRLGPELLKISQEHPNIQEIQVIRDPGHRKLPITQADVLSLGGLFPRITILRLNNLSMRQWIVEALAWADIFPDLSELYLDNNGQIEGIEVLSHAPFARNLTKLSLAGTKVKHLSEEQLKQLFPQVKEVIFSTPTSISSSSTASTPQEHWRVEGNKLTVSIYAIRNLGMALFRLIGEYSNIREIQVVRGTNQETQAIAEADVLSLGAFFPSITALRLNGLNLRQNVASRLAYANFFANLSELYLDDNSELEDVEMLSRAPFARNLTRLSLVGTGVDPSNPERLRQLFPHAEVIFGTPERAAADNVQESARTTGANSGASREEDSSICQAIEQRDVNLVREILRAQSGSLYYQVGYERQTPLQAVLSISPEDPVRLQLLLAILEGALQFSDNTIFNQVINLRNAELKALLRELLNASSSFRDTAPAIMERLEQINERRVRQLAIGDIYEEVSWIEEQRARLPEAFAQDLYESVFNEGVRVDSSGDELVGESISQVEDVPSGKGIHEPSSTSSLSSSSFSSSQEDWWVEGDKLTVSIEAIKRRGSDLLKEIKRAHPNIREIQVVRRLKLTKIAAQDIKLLGEYFRDITVLRLNSLTLRQHAVEVLAWANIFPDLSELYLDDNNTFNNVEVLSKAPFAQALTRLSLQNTQVNPLSEGHLRQLFPQVREVIFSTSTSSSSSSSASNLQENWVVEGDRLTVSVEEIKELGPDLLKRIKSNYPNIQEIQVVRRSWGIRLAGQDIMLLGQHFPDVTVLRLNGLNLRQRAANVFGRRVPVPLFPRLFELYLDNNGEVEDVEVLARAPFVSTLTRLSLADTRVDPSSAGRLRQLFPHAEVTFGTPERAEVDSAQEGARTTGANSGASREEESSIYQAIERRDVNLVREIPRVQPGSLHYQVGYERQALLQAVLSMSPEDPVRIQLLLAVLEGALRLPDDTIFGQIINQVDDAMFKALLRELFNVGSRFNDAAPQIIERLQQVDVLRVGNALGALYNELSSSERQRADQLTNAVNARMGLQRPVSLQYYSAQPGMFWD